MMEKKTITVQGMSFTGYEGDYVFQTVETTQDYYESALLNRWSPLVRDPAFILDVGANLGNHTMFWSRFFPGAGIISMEPLPENYECLIRNIADNRLSSVRALRVAAGEKPGHVCIDSFDPENLGSTSFRYSDDQETITAEIRTLDSVREEFRLSGIGLVKIDTEGFELSILKGMPVILEQDRPVLWIECGADTIAEVLRLLTEKNYRLVSLEGANALFFPAESSPESEIRTETLLVSNLTLLSKVNAYYRNYETSKRWCASKDRQLAAVQKRLEEAEAHRAGLSAQISALSEEKRAMAGELDTARADIVRLKELNESYLARLSRDAQVFAEEEAFLAALRRQIQQLNSQLQLAKQQNAEYLEKLNKVYGTWYGKIALRVYKALRKLKHAIIRK